jgi:hypothetical protein
MLYINKNEINELVLNINNNSMTQYATYSLVFTHIMSKNTKTYTIDTTNPAQYTSNIRYCTITLDLSIDNLIYEGQYNLNIYGNTDNLVYITIANVDGVQESKPFTEYVSNNEENTNYIYIQE